MRAPILIGDIFNPGKLRLRPGAEHMICFTLGRPCALVIIMRDEHVAQVRYIIDRT